ncbi:MAG: hypothetical protein BWY57_00459 [Betaproteobacteria bacterium ADurb.Bin341]|nr:MAG: hypothetical protein BWY57_00459 [Betaproteobacteria bacterium ADurb.Bin341]
MTASLRKAALLCAAFFLAACANIPRFGGSRPAVEDWAKARGFQPVALATPPFDLLALARLRQAPPKTPLTIYIEGDGAAWPRPHLPPADPTPTRPIALALADADRSPAVAYLGRPCQYLSVEALSRCPVDWWTTKRFSPEVLGAYQQALDGLKTKTGYQRLRLVGYSGGGVLATLLAEQRGDVVQLTTIAAPLALAAWTAWHHVSPLPEAFDPIKLNGRARVAAVHYVGDRDDIVPEPIVRAYVTIRGGDLRQVAGADHDSGWLEFWRGIHGKESDRE